MCNPTAERQKPKNYLVWSIVSVVLCFPFGIPAILNATKVNSLWTDGYYEEAEKASRKAKRWTIASVACNVIFYMLYIAAIATWTVYRIDKATYRNESIDEEETVWEEMIDDVTDEQSYI